MKLIKDGFSVIPANYDAKTSPEFDRRYGDEVGTRMALFVVAVTVLL